MGVRVVNATWAHNATTKRFVQKVTIIFVNTYTNILLYVEILNQLILIVHIEVRYSPLYYGLLILHYRPLEAFQKFNHIILYRKFQCIY